MNQTKKMEMVGILSLSTLVTSAYSVSGSLPEMMKDFPTCSRASMETLLSVPAFAMMIIIALIPVLLRMMRERTMLITGLLLTGVAGIVPVFSDVYSILFLSRIALGIGIGLINTKAVSMIGERFSGPLRQRLQGIRCSMETLGQATTVFLSGQLLIWGWHASFFIYGAAFLVLALYLLFVPAEAPAQEKPVTRKASGRTASSLTVGQWATVLLHAGLGGLTVMALVQNSLRISGYMIETGIGTAVDGSMVLSISIFAGFLGGLLFGSVLPRLKAQLLPLSMLITAGGFLVIVLSQSNLAITVGMSLCGFFTTWIMSYMFNSLSDHVPSESLDTANAVVLVGCNLGSSVTPLVLSGIGHFLPGLNAGFLFFSCVYLVLAATVFVFTGSRRVKTSPSKP